MGPESAAPEQRKGKRSHSKFTFAMSTDPIVSFGFMEAQIGSSFSNASLKWQLLLRPSLTPRPQVANSKLEVPSACAPACFSDVEQPVLARVRRFAEDFRGKLSRLHVPEDCQGHERDRDDPQNDIFTTLFFFCHK